VLEAEVCGSVRIAIGTISGLRLPSQSPLQTVPRRLPRTPAFLHCVQVGNGEWMLVVAAIVVASKLGGPIVAARLAKILTLRRAASSTEKLRHPNGRSGGSFQSA
jgi:hypothetical protein